MNKFEINLKEFFNEEPQVIDKSNFVWFIEKFFEKYPDIVELEIQDSQRIFIKQNRARSFFNITIDKNVYLSFASNDTMYLAEQVIELKDGSVARVHITLAPVCNFPIITIAHKVNKYKTLESLKSAGMMNDSILGFIKDCVINNLTCVISGGTGTGKSTMLEAMTREFSEDTRVGVCEDVPELRLEQANTIYLHSNLWKPGVNINNTATLSWCVQQLNRQRVDKIIVGETRGKEFADFITAANSGYDGSLTTIHANSPQLALQKMADFIMIASPRPMRSINQLIANTIDIIIQIGFDKNGINRVMDISCVLRTLGNDESATISLQNIYKYDDGFKFAGHFPDDISKKIINKSDSDTTQARIPRRGPQ